MTDEIPAFLRSPRHEPVVRVRLDWLPWACLAVLIGSVSLLIIGARMWL